MRRMDTVVAVVFSWWGLGIGMVGLVTFGFVVWRLVLEDFVLDSIELP